MAKPAFKWLIIANVIIGVNASGMAQDANQGKTFGRHKSARSASFVAMMHTTLTPRTSMGR